MAADFSTNHMEIEGFDCGSMVLDWTGANATTALFIPQFSNDLICWCDYVAEADAQKVGGAAGCKMYEFSTFCFRFLRLKFLRKTNSAGSFSTLAYAKRFWGRNQ